MTAPRISDRAKADLDDIWDYVAAHDEAAADRLIDDVLAAARVYAGQPRLGRPRGDLRPGLRSFAVGNYVVFFRPAAGTIDIVRVLHGSRDIPAAFADDADE